VQSCDQKHKIKASGTKCKKKRELYEKEKQESFCKRARPVVPTNSAARRGGHEA
jgi:hypothetical protein